GGTPPCRHGAYRECQEVSGGAGFPAIPAEPAADPAAVGRSTAPKHAQLVGAIRARPPACPRFSGPAPSCVGQSIRVISWPDTKCEIQNSESQIASSIFLIRRSL